MDKKQVKEIEKKAEFYLKVGAEIIKEVAPKVGKDATEYFVNDLFPYVTSVIPKAYEKVKNKGKNKEDDSKDDELILE